MTFHVLPTSPGDETVAVHDGRDPATVRALLDELDRVDSWVADATENGTGDLADAISRQSQARDDVSIHVLTVEEARALSQALTAATFRAGRVAGPPSTYRSSGRD